MGRLLGENLLKGMQESHTEKEEMKQQRRMKIMIDMTREIKSKGRNGNEQQLVGQYIAGKPTVEERGSIQNGRAQ